MNKQGTITFLEKVRIQARVLVPLIKAFERELGSNRARSLAREALQNSVRQSYAKLREKNPGNPVELIPGGIAMFAEDALEYEVIVHTSEVFDFNVTKCAYADFYKAMGEPDLGFLFVCEQDHAIAEGLGSDLEFRRTQTIMQGATHCDFRFRHITIGSDPNNDSLGEP